MATMLDRLLRRATYPGTYSEADYSGAQYVTTGGATTGPAGNRESSPPGIVREARAAYKANGIVFACLAVQQWLLSEARFKFQSKVDDHLFGDQSLAIVENPWPNGDSGDLLARMGRDGALGNAWIRKVVPAAGGDAQLIDMRPEAVTIISQELPDDQGRVYRVPIGYAEDMGPGREPQFYSVDEVGHYAPLPDPDARWRGMSWLTPILREVHADQALTGYKAFHLDNGAQPGLTVKYSMKLSEPTVETLRKRIRARYGGPENAGNVLILDEGADVSATGSTLEQLQADAVTKAGERRICAAAGPGMLIICGFEQGDYMHAVRQMADLWARPHWRMICSALEHLVPTSATSAPVRLWYDVDGVAALREGELERSQSFLVRMQGLASAVQAGFSRESAILAADSGDISLLKPDPNAPAPGMAGRVTETEKFGAPSGGPGQPPTGGPAGGLPGRPPQAGRPQQLPGVGSPNLPNALPGKVNGSKAVPSARGAGRSDIPFAEN